ncbi:MAG: InlB B-repeat-containing protein [Clostridia bacterium]|nr:InlB B-repeat-containing protein [Clostridia bacterium]
MRKQKHALKRSLAFLLMLATLLGIFPISTFATGTTELETDKNVADIIILHNGAELSSLTLAEDGKETLTAHITIAEFDSRAWQIRIPDTEEWVNISGRSGEALDVTYALVGSMLNESGRAYLRHVIQNGDTLYESEPVEVILSYSTPESAESANTSNVKLATFATKRLTATKLTATADTTDATETPDTGSESTTQLVSIVINYLFDNGGIAFEPYGATIAKGSDFAAKIDSPTVMGYEPFRRIDANYEPAPFVEFQLTNVQENVTINVIYEPAIVKFQIHHHLQNINDDDYSLHADFITDGYGLTGSKIPDALTMDIPGFKPLAYEKDITIAADGSTVVEIRYDRNYYLLSFEMAGGYGTDPVYARYGTEVGANPPTKHGYIFSGWELISFGDAVPTDAQKSTYDINGEGKTIELPDANLKYLAKWVTQLTTYTMVFWKENINDNGFTYWGYLDGLSAMSGSLVSGADRIDEVSDITEDDYFTYNDMLTDKDVIVEGDGSTIVNVYYTRNRYAITFKAPGKCVIEADHTHTYDDCYVTICGAHHIHSEACNPTLHCTTPEHKTHTSACLQCDLVEHTHDQSCYCGNEEHTHTVSCWTNVGNKQNSKPNGAPNDPKDGQVFVFRRNFISYYYIYIKGSWYRFNGSASSGTIVDPSCDYGEEHTHSTDCIECGFAAEHTHAGACYTDTLHTHNEDCYTYSCGDKEHIHTDACYLLNCGMPTGHTHSTNCNSASRSNTVKIVYAKYQADLHDIWPITDDNGVTYDSGERWEPSGSTYYSAVLVYIANMPADDFTLTLNTASYNPYTMNYYLEVLPGESYTHSYGGKNYVLYTTVKASYNYITKAEDFFDIHGYAQGSSDPSFSSNGQISISGSNKNVNFYYNRIVDHKLEFSSNGSVLTEKTQTGIMYGAPIAEYKFTPSYPTNLEQGAFVFGGWYTSSGCYDGTEVDWSTATMEAGDMLLYAKWEPIVHSLEIYTKYENGEYVGKIGDTQLVTHNHFAHAPATNPENGQYIFQGWFYIDKEDGEEKAFVFTGIPVDQDMKIYAKWGSDVSVKYTIYYVLQKDKTPIADPTQGAGLAGHNKTFHAKVEGELYTSYQSGYYPLTSSHTITMSAEVEEHVFTFEYVFVESMPYEVRYVDTTGKVLLTKEVKDNNLSVVTETFVKMDGKMPDAYQKRLVLSAKGTDADGNGILDNNVITFVYEEDEDHAYYKVVHYIRNIADDGYREYRSEEQKGKIKEAYTFTPITLAGFAFNAEKALLNGQKATVTNGTITATLGKDGMLVELYYDRVNVTYTVNYLESGTNKVLYEAKTATGLYGAQVVEQAIGLTHLGYTLENDAIKQLHLSFNTDLNVIDFYYKESTYALKYTIVGAAEGGNLTQTSENVFAVSTKKANGSAPILYKGYKFVGWFLDEACSKPVPAEWVDVDGKLTPDQDNGGELWLSNRTFYAKIEPNVTSMTISTYGASNIDAGQVFIYRIQGTSESVNHIDFTVTVTGNSTVTISDLAVGNYRITELTDWSYRYSVVNAEKDISLSVDPAKNTVSFSHVRSFTQWLDSNHSITNIFSK